MKSLRQGSAAISDAVLALTQELLETFTHSEGGDVHLLTGIMLADPRTGRRVISDLIVVMEAAVLVGIDVNRDSSHTTTPRAVARLLADLLQREQMVTQPLPVYAFWLGGATPEGHADDTPVLPDAATVRQYIPLINVEEIRLAGDALASLAEGLLRQDAGLQGRKRSPVSHLRHALLGLVELPGRINGGLQEQIRRPFIFRRMFSGPILPADVNKHLEKAMLARENVLEDVDYTKVVPNDYIVELNDNNYKRNYEPIEQKVCERWQARLLEVLNTTNDRRGRKEYKFGGRVQVRIRPVSDLAEGEARIWCQVSPDVDVVLTTATLACLELISSGRRWSLREGMVTIGRDDGCDICLDMPAVQRARLVSGQHAYIIHKDREYHLFDGAPGGRPSTNGTFVNGQRVGPDGQELDDGDVIILAALDPDQPRSDTPGAVAFFFRLDCAK
jgi:hypothetical protein